MELKIEYMNPADLVPYEGNARSHAEEDVSAIVELVVAIADTPFLYLAKKL